MTDRNSKKARAEYAEKVERIKRLALIAMFSDDDLMGRLVLKGGNAMDLILGVGSRASRDLDFSIPDELTEEEVASFKERVENLLRSTFNSEGFEVIDVNFFVVPASGKATDPALFFWGGYQIDFKVLEIGKAQELQDDLGRMRKQAFVLGEAGSPKFSIEISKYEYCEAKQEVELEGYTIYVYSPAMIVAEKLRAICQKTNEYAEIVRTKSQGERARDFFDIYMLIEKFRINLRTEENSNLIKSVFGVKRVPLSLLGHIEAYRERHRAGFEAVRATVKAGVEVKEFDFYFDYVMKKAMELQALWEV